ncbi:hypothetical protein BV22DRAFT_1104644 [Leucogyrophana mollusca]|uniref:Uncharacterized protein n=1 Tax=Leucogyrophana mollusca TaxID=85980 RepID=A0ACB8BL03_9AGAM|nr:hypothetical protein BV22DRAFT_1104644 [Leucogyrophana mollusca]
MSTDDVKNILIFGQTGAGKSSLVNLIAQADVADTSSDGSSCTLKSTSYSVTFDSCAFCIFDTVGLNEPHLSGTEYISAAERACNLVNELKNAGGIHLLVFCMGEPRITQTVQQNYRLFYEFLCREEVSVALVITHMENEDPMDSWWDRNTKKFKEFGITPVGHACVATARGLNERFVEQYEESKEKVRDLLKEHGTGKPFSMKRRSWIMRVLRFLAELVGISPSYHTRREVVDNLVRRCGISKEEAEVLATKAGFVEIEGKTFFQRWFPASFMSSS